MEKATFFKHHRINPESRPFDNHDDAQHDTVFEEIMDQCRHTEWGKFFGDAAKPSTSIVFGQQGSGKTALRRQMLCEMERYNSSPRNGKKVFVVEYVDFNEFHANFEKHMGRTIAGADDFRLWKQSDHIDSILSRAVAQFVTDIVEDRQKIDTLDRMDRHKLLNLALIYDTLISDSRRKLLEKKLRLFWAISYPFRRWDCWFSWGGFSIGFWEVIGAVVVTLTGAFAGATLAGTSPWLFCILPIIFLSSFIPGCLKRSHRDQFVSQTISAVWALPKPDHPGTDMTCQMRKCLLYKLWNTDYCTFQKTGVKF